MNLRIFFAILMGAVIFSRAHAGDGSGGEVVSFAVAKDGSGWASIRSNPHLLEVKRSKNFLRVDLIELSMVTDVVPSPSVEWSWDGKFLMVKYQSEESASTVEIFDAKDLKRVARFPVDDAKWLFSSHYLVVVEANPELDSIKVQRGLVVFDPLRNEKNRIAEQHVFIGKVDTGIKHALAQAISKRGDRVYIEPINVLVRLRVPLGR